MNVGVRELKSHLSGYLKRAAAGEHIVVTDHGRPVARLVPYAEVSAVRRGIEEGWIEAPRRTGLGTVERFTSSLSSAEVLDDDRG